MSHRTRETLEIAYGTLQLAALAALTALPFVGLSGLLGLAGRIAGMP